MKIYKILLLVFTLAEQRSDISGQINEKAKVITLQAGYINYSSINTISDPFLYGGKSVNYLAGYELRTQNKILGISANYSNLLRKPINVHLPAFYDIINADNGNTYRVYSDKHEKRTSRLELKFTYYKKLNFKLSKNDNIYLGLTEKNYFVLESDRSNPEIVSLSLNPGFIYNISIRRILIQFENSLSAIAINVRRPYAHMDSKFETGKVSDLEFAVDHFQLDLINTHFEFISQLSILKNISKKIDLQITYGFSYMNSKLPRKLSSVTTILNTGLSYTF